MSAYDKPLAVKVFSRFQNGRAALFRVLRFTLGLALILWAVWGLDWALLAQSLSHLQWVWVVAAFLSFLLSLALKLARWRWLLAQLVPHIGWLPLARALFWGQVVNIMGLGRWGDIARVLWLRRESGVSGVGLATSVVAEKLLDIVFLGLAAGGWLFFWLTPPESVNLSGFLFLSGASGLGVGLFAWLGQPTLTWLHGRLAAWSSPLGKWLAPRVAALADGLAGLTQRRQLGRGLLLSAVIWGIMALTNLLLLGAFGLPLSGKLALSVLVLGHLGVVTHLTPANIGPAHWAIMLALTIWGVAQSTALAYAVVIHAIVTLAPVAIAFVLNGWHWPNSQTIASLAAANE